MRAHDDPLLLIQWPGLAQNGLRHTELAGVVHRCGQFQARTAVVVPAAGQGQGASIGRHAPDVGAGIGVVVMSGLAQHHDRLPVALLQNGNLHARQMGVHSGPDNLRQNGLDDVVDAAGFKAGRLVLGRAVTGDKDDLQAARRIELPDLSTQIVAIDVWQADVQQRQRGLVLDDSAPCFSPIAGRHQRIAVC